MSLLKNIINFLFPSYCIICGKRLLNGEEVLCLQCNLELPRTRQWKTPYDNTLVARFWGKMKIEKGISFLYHVPQSPSAQLIYHLKYKNRPDVARVMGKILAEEIGASRFFADIDCIIPVPITQKRRRGRGYNQSEELARCIGERYTIPVMSDVVGRMDGIASQITKARKDRPDNVSGAFYATEQAQEALAGKHCLLLDDIITTGSTLIECSRVLSTIPGISFSVLSWGCVKKV